MFKFAHIARVLLSLFVLLQLFVFSASAQYGNEWIVPGQTYYKIPVAQTGMYAISGGEFAAKFPLASFIDPRNIELWHRGVQQNIYIRGESDGTFDSVDSLFFFGERNDGTLDSLLYQPYGNQPHKYYNLYSDTTAYFLTWSASAGNRMPVSNLSSAVVPEAYHISEILNVYSDEYDSGYRYNSDTYLTTGDQGEGWFGPWISDGTSLAYVLNTPNVNPVGPQASLEIMFVGRNGPTSTPIHIVDILIGNPASPDTTFSVPSFAFHDVVIFKAPISLSSFSGGNISVSIRNNGNGTNPSGVSVAYIKLTYPEFFNMGSLGEKYFNLQANAGLSNVEISNTAGGTAIYDISDKNNIEQVASSVQGGLLKATLAASVLGRKLYVVASSNYLPISSVKKVNMEVHSNNTTADYIMITNRKIMTGAKEYSDYRASVQGGSYDTLLADVDQLYDTYAYGERTPVAIRRFVKHLFDIGKPKYLFIIGKGLSINYNNGPYYYRKNSQYYINDPIVSARLEDLVPTFGTPCSDLLFSMGLDGNPQHVYIPVLATGRLSAKSNDEVIHYLNKIKEHDLLKDVPWRKNLIHLSGGHDQGEWDSFAKFMNNTLKPIAEGPVFGGKVVKTFSKSEDNMVQDDLISTVADEVNKGVSYLTFFGHASTGSIDLDIGYVSNDIYGYHNDQGKYPMLFINGCGSAQVFGNGSFTEDWILTPNKGAILALGHTDAGYADELVKYSEFFYRNAFQKKINVGKSVGDIHLATINDFYNNTLAPPNPTDPRAIANLQQMIIQGDPALVLYSPIKPDYQITSDKLFIKSFDNNNVVTAVSDSFAIGIVVTNVGADFGDSLSVSVKRMINGKTTMLGPIAYKHVSYQDTILFIVKSKDIATYGENSFEIMLDPYNSIPESDETNNTASLTYFIPLSGVTALFPKEYSIVNSPSATLTLVAQSTNLFIDNTSYYFEIDTSYLFNSSLLRSTTINGGALVKWPNLVLPYTNDSTVYYWRVRFEDVPQGADTLYGESSFIYINGSPEGWSQSEFPQFLKDGLNKVDRNIDSRKWSFSNSDARIYIKSLGTSYSLTGYDSSLGATQPSHLTTVQINGIINEFGGYCTENALIAIAFDKNTAASYTPYSSAQGGSNCGTDNSGVKLNQFYSLDSTSTEAQNQSDLINYINNVPDGDYVLFLSTGNASFSSWSSLLKTKFKNTFGAAFIDSLSNGLPYILLAKKNVGSTPVFEKYGTSTEVITHEDTLLGTSDKGYITSTLIGPASQWGTFYRNFNPSEIPVTDVYDVKIIGVDIQGNNIDTLTIPFVDSLDLTTVSGLNSYPYLRLLAEVTDTANLTPPQLKKWQVIYSGVPEGIMNPSMAGPLSQYNTVTKQEGDSISVCYAFENISTHDFPDTLLVKYTITNSSQGTSSNTVPLTKLKRDTLITFCHKFSTRGLQGNNILQAYVNPQIQPEEYYNNNIVEMSFIVEKDNVNPVLDVVFDGTHIMDGDIVSPSPMVTVTLNDENKFLIIDSPNDIEMFLQKPGDPTPTKVSLTGPEIKSAKQIGTNGKNVFQIEYNPQNLPDGIYTLIVRGTDVSQNASGALDYKINFEVINESTITNFYPYPNPFSTSTRFVFTLTGSEIPEDLKIQIMTVTGKVVREITKAELGMIRIGNNKSDYAWDGTDEFGDRLANGVYLYRVLLKNGGNIQHRNTAGDKAFKKNFGKLYILR